MSDTVLEFKNVNFSYNETANVKDLNVEIKKGSFTALTGSNGAGKSTFSKLCNGLLKPSSGDVFVLGENEIWEVRVFGKVCEACESARKGGEGGNWRI